MIGDCLKSVSFCDEIILIDSGSIDKTVKIATDEGAKVFKEESNDFSEKRNLGLEKAHGDWILYVDADERISKELKESITTLLDYSPSGTPGVFRLKRKNYYLGNHPWPKIEKMERLFKRTVIKGWEGALHESPKTTGNTGELDGYLIHYTHRDITKMVEKTNQWSETEAELRIKHHHPQMSWWRFPRVMLSAFADSYFKQGGWRVGTAGFVESMYQAFSSFITYAKLWELQQEKK
jgi:glycosyltransferase involved in cell wall biosynthesis